MSEQRVITDEQIKRIIKALGYIGAKMDALDEVLGDTFEEYVGYELTAISDIILDVMGVPADTTAQQGSELGFCRDWFDEQIVSVQEEIDPLFNIARDANKECVDKRVDIVYEKLATWRSEVEG